MEQELVKADNSMVDEQINADLFELPPLKEMNEIISEFEKSGMADEPSIFDGIESELEIDEQQTEDSFNLNVSEVEQAGITCDSFKEEVTNIILDEKDIPEIDFEISKDIFDDIKIKEEDIADNIHHISLEHSNFRNETIPLPSDLKQNILQEQVELETGQYKENTKDDVNIRNQDQCNFKINDSLNEKIIAEIDQQKINKIDEENLKTREVNNLIENETNENIFKSLEDIENFENEMNKNSPHSKEGANKVEEESSEMVIDEECSLIETNIELPSKSVMSSIDETIESVIKASAELCDTADEKIDDVAIEKDTPGKKSSNIMYNDDQMKNAVNKIPMKKKTHGIFDVVVPLIGKNVMEPGNDTPFNHRYDLAKQRNELRAKYQQKVCDFPIPNTSYQEWRRQKSSRSKEQIEKEEQEETVNAIQLATAFTKIAIRILHEYNKEPPNEVAMIKYFGYFECAPASPLSLLYAPHFVHTMMLCRGDADLSFKLRRIANDCYEKCHALFAIPEGYNFETVYTSEVKKNIPDEFDHLNELELNYGDYDSSDFEDESQSGSESDGNENWS